jgi:hypothetical protein
MLHRAADLAGKWSELNSMQMRPMLAALIKRIVVRVDRVDIHLLPNRFAALLSDELSWPTSAETADEEQPLVLSVPAKLRRVGFGIKILIDEASAPGHAAKADPRLIKLIAVHTS